MQVTPRSKETWSNSTKHCANAIYFHSKPLCLSYFFPGPLFRLQPKLNPLSSLNWLTGIEDLLNLVEAWMFAMCRHYNGNDAHNKAMHHSFHFPPHWCNSSPLSSSFCPHAHNISTASLIHHAVSLSHSHPTMPVPVASWLNECAKDILRCAMILWPIGHSEHQLFNRLEISAVGTQLELVHTCYCVAWSLHSTHSIRMNWCQGQPLAWLKPLLSLLGHCHCSKTKFACIVKEFGSFIP